MSLPSGYKRLEYIQSSGTQYIDTGLSAPTGMRVQCDVELTSLRSGMNVLFGSHDASDPYYRNYLAASSNGYWEIGAYGVGTFGSVTTGRKYNIDVCTISGSLSAKIDGTAYAIGNIAQSTKRSDLNVYLFALNYAGGLLWSSMKLYSAKIYLDAAGSSPARDFIPCKNASGVVGLWDDANSKFYTNAGTGVFTAGPEVVGSNRVLVDAKGYDANSGTVLVNGMVYHLKKGRGLLNGMGHDIPFNSGTPISDLAIGSTVKIAVNGTLRDFLIVHQGLPSSLYDDSCNGTWLLMKDIYEQRQWHSSNVNKLESSTIHSYLNSTFLDLFDSNIKDAIKQVKIPYRKNGGSGGTNQSGANGLSCKIFLLSGYEVGWTSSDNQYFPQDGAKLSYFESGTGTSANNKRIAKLNGSAAYWWLRSPLTYYPSSVWCVLSDGKYSGNLASNSLGIRPAFILPSDTLVSDDGTIIT